MRVLFVVPKSVESATSRYRCTHLAESLALRGIIAEVASSFSESVTVAHEVVVLHRLSWGDTGRRFTAAARAAGATLVFGVDDLLFEPEYAYHAAMLRPDDHDRYAFHRSEVEYARQTLCAADAALVSTEFLANRVQVIAPTVPVHLIRNFLPTEILRLSAEAAGRRDAVVRQDDRVVLGYLSGSPTHDGDFADIAVPLAAVLHHHTNTRLFIVGEVQLPPLLQPFADAGRVRRHPFVPWRDLPGLLAQIDINLAPLDPTRPFNHAKSEVKYLEAAAASLPTVAGNTMGVREAFGEIEGCLLRGSDAEWEKTLNDLVCDREKRHQLGIAARKAVQEKGTAEYYAESLATLFTALAGTKVITPVVVRRPFRKRIEERLRSREAFIVRKWQRLTRHLRLMREEQKRGAPI